MRPGCGTPKPGSMENLRGKRPQFKMQKNNHSLSWGGVGFYQLESSGGVQTLRSHTSCWGPIQDVLSFSQMPSEVVLLLSPLYR